jgi:hypothetical protein
MLLALCAAVPASAEERVVVQGLADIEGWNSTRSPLLERHEGEPSGLARTRLWASAAFGDHVQGFVLGEFSGGSADRIEGAESELEQAWVQYSFAPERRLLVRAGRLLQPMGGFAARYLSSRNPLIGEPFGQGRSYPLGVQVSGAAGMFDYVAAVVDQPPSTAYGEKDPRALWRPMISLGLRPAIGMRVGVHATRGPYLAEDQLVYLPGGMRDRDVTQDVHGLELSFSRGHVEVLGEITRTRSSVPDEGTSRGAMYTLEPRLTLSPRWFAAARLEAGRFLEVHGYPGWWKGWKRSIHALEAGAGFRVDLALHASPAL